MVMEEGAGTAVRDGVGMDTRDGAVGTGGDGVGLA